MVNEEEISNSTNTGVLEQDKMIGDVSIEEKKKQLLRLRFLNNLSGLSQPLEIRKLRKEIARELTRNREKIYGR